MTTQFQERVLVLPVREVLGADDGDLLSAAEFDRRVSVWARDLPAWPVVVTVTGKAPACLFDQPTDGFTGQVARYPMVGKVRQFGRVAMEGKVWWARAKGSTVADASHHETHWGAVCAAR